MIADKLLKPGRGATDWSLSGPEWAWVRETALIAVPFVEQGALAVRDYARRQRRDLVSMLPSDWVVGPHGPELNFGTNENDNLSLDDTALNGETDITIFYESLTDSTATQSALSAANSGESNEILIFNNTTTNVLFYYGEGNISGFVLPTQTNVRTKFWFERDQTNTENRLYLNTPDNLDTQSASAMSALVIGSGGLLFGQDQDTVGGGFEAGQRLIARVPYLYVFRGFPSNGQRRQLMNDPFGPFRAASNVIAFVAPAGGSTIPTIMHHRQQQRSA